MTTPAPPPPPQPTQPQQQSPGQTAAEATVAAVVAAQLAGMLGMPGFRWGANREQRRQMLGSQQSTAIVSTLGRVGVQPLVGRAVLAMTLTHSPIPNTTRPAREGTATRGMQVTNLNRRASYLVAASQRVQRDVNQAQAARDAGATVLPRPDGFTPSPRPRPIIVPRPDGRPPSPAPTIPGLPPGTPLDPLPGTDAGKRLSEDLADALRREKIYWQAHKAAQQKRDAASKQVDVAAGKFGELLGWYAVRDERTTPECKQSDGRNFYRSVPPNIGLPGTVHPACRCFAGKAHDTDETVYTVPPIEH